MSVLDISSAIIDNVEAMPETCDYVYIGLTFSILLSLVPAFCRLCEVNDSERSVNTRQNSINEPISGRTQFDKLVRNKHLGHPGHCIRESLIFVHYHHEICIWRSNLGEIGLGHWFCATILPDFSVLLSAGRC